MQSVTLNSCERVIDAYERGRLVAAQALRTIHDKKLYKPEYKTFEAYCRQRWHWSRQHGQRMIDFAETAEHTTPKGYTPLRESHARPFATLTIAQKQKAGKRCANLPEEKRTAAAIERIVKQVVNDTPIATLRPVQATGSHNQYEENVLCGDVLDILPTLGDRTINLVVTSPPYADQRKGHYPGIPETDYPGWMTKVMAALRPKLTADASVLIVIRPHVRKGVISDYVLRTRLALRDDGWSEIDEYVWDKPDAGPLGSTMRLRRSWESVLHFAPSNNPFIDLRACGQDSERIGFKGKDRFEGVGQQNLVHGFSQKYSPGRSRATDVFRAPVGGVTKGVNHPAQFPSKLPEQLIETFSRPGDLVADIFAGSGTTLLAAKSLGRKCVGIDISMEYVSLARQRLAEVKQADAA